MWQPYKCGECGLVLCRSHLPRQKHNCTYLGRPFYRRYRTAFAATVVLLLIIAALLLLFLNRQEGYEQRYPSIYGNIIVWQDNRTGDWNIYAYNLSSGEENQITSDSAKHGRPKIYGDIIVWSDNRTGNFDVYAYDLAENKEMQITSSPEDEKGPLVCEDVIVFTKEYGLFIYNLSSQEQREVWEGFAGSVSVGEDRVVWDHWHQLGGDFILGISMYDLSAGQVHEIVSGRDTNQNPAICDDTIAWVWGNRTIQYGALSGPEQQIVVYNMSSQQRKQITWDLVERAGLSAWENTLVWQEKRNDNWDIHMYDLGTGQETQITTDPAAQVGPCLYDKTMAWQDNRDGHWRIHVYDRATGQERRLPQGLR